MFIRILMLGLVALLGACAGSAPIGEGANIAYVQEAELPPPTRMDQSAAARPYLIGPFDKLFIDVFGVDELKRQVTIDASGRLSFPLIGVIEASGQTPEELGETIKDRLRGRFIRDPQVTVNLQETVSQVITLDGQVEKPGLYPVVGRMTLMRAVATAGGVSEFAKLSDVVLFREVDGQKMVGLYNLKGIRRGNYADPEIFANDVIIVGDSPSRRLFRDIVQGSSLITTPLLVLLRK